MSDLNDHDLLITIANDTKWLKDKLVDHIKEEAASLAILSGKVESAHKRIDWLLVSGVLAVVVLGLSVFLK